MQPERTCRGLHRPLIRPQPERTCRGLLRRRGAVDSSLPYGGASTPTRGAPIYGVPTSVQGVPTYGAPTSAQGGPTYVQVAPTSAQGSPTYGTPDLRPELGDLRPGRPDLRCPNLRPGRPDLLPGRPDLPNLRLWRKLQEYLNKPNSSSPVQHIFIYNIFLCSSL